MTILAGEVAQAIRDGYRVAVHDAFFPFTSFDPKNPGVVHAVVDHRARAIFCSKEWFEKSKPVQA